jgi:hypothetical protein
MANEIEINVKADTSDAVSSVERIGTQTTATSRVVVQAMGSTEEAFDTAARGSGKLGAALDKTAGFAGGLGEGIAGVGDVASGVSDIMSYSARKAEELAQAQQDVQQAAQDADQALQDLKQANRDLAQAELDTKQAAIDVRQALHDQRVAQEEYNKAVKEHGRSSNEAVQAAIDLSQATQDLGQAEEDEKQAKEDAAQANLDAKQAALDNSQANKDLAASQREVAKQGSTMTKISEYAGMLSGVLGGLVGIIGMVTAVQWAWNAAMTANPVGLVIVAIAALIAIIVVIATKTDWFQRLWKAIWSKIGDPVKATFAFIKAVFQAWWAYVQAVLGLFKKVFTAAFKFAVDWVVKYFRFIYNILNNIRNLFAKIGGYILSPFRAGFNAVSRAWNNTVGRLRWSVPQWVPLIGGNSISAPSLPTFATGSDEILRTGIAMVHKGERIIPASGRGFSGRGNGPVEVILSLKDGGSRFARELLRLFTATVRVNNGDV